MELKKYLFPYFEEAIKIMLTIKVPWVDSLGQQLIDYAHHRIGYSPAVRLRPFSHLLTKTQKRRFHGSDNIGYLKARSYGN